MSLIRLNLPAVCRTRPPFGTLISAPARARRGYGSDSILKANAVDSLQRRGLLSALTSPTLETHLSQQARGVYAGFDPTAPSLHIGNLLTIIALCHFLKNGHRVICVVGGATGQVGDPSGRNSERSALQVSELNVNNSALEGQLKLLFTRARNYMQSRHSKLDIFQSVQIVNNRDWFGKVGLLDFLGGVGRMGRVTDMLKRDSVKTRIASLEGISFTEFAYQLLQAYDFLHLHRELDVSVQVGGSDQWGNIIGGIDLIRRTSDKAAFGLTIPLVTNDRGEKLGKSVGNALWLSPDLVSPFDFYQFFRRTPDSQLETFLKYFTFLPLDEISQVLALHQTTPHHHAPQRLLAFEVTSLVHGEIEAKNAQNRSGVLYDSQADSLSAREVMLAFKGDERCREFKRAEIIGKSCWEVAFLSGVTDSKCMYIPFAAMTEPNPLFCQP